MQHHLTAFLCGNFCYDRYEPTRLEQCGWEREILDNKQYLYNAYAHEYVNFCYADDVANGCVRWHKTLNKRFQGEQSEGEQTFRAVELKLYFFPDQIAIFSIEVDAEAAALNAFTTTLYAIRLTEGDTSKASVVAFAEMLNPLKEIVKELSDKALPRQKMRIFQIVGSQDYSDDNDTLLCKLGTLSNDCNGSEPYLSRDYTDKILKNGKLSIYANWDALALLDTFTIFASPQVAEEYNWQWRDFLSSIYVHSLYQKQFLYTLNDRYRKVVAQQHQDSWYTRIRQRMLRKLSDIEVLTRKFDHYNQYACFHRISYNFLPLEVDRAIDNGLELNDEQQQLADALHRAHFLQAEQNNETIKIVLFFVSIFALFSAVWDGSSLFSTIFNGEDHPTTFWAIAVFAVAVIALAYFLFKKRK